MAPPHPPPLGGEIPAHHGPFGVRERGIIRQLRVRRCVGGHAGRLQLGQYLQSAGIALQGLHGQSLGHGLGLCDTLGPLALTDGDRARHLHSEGVAQGVRLAWAALGVAGLARLEASGRRRFTKADLVVGLSGLVLGHDSSPRRAATASNVSPVSAWQADRPVTACHRRTATSTSCGSLSNPTP